MRLFLLYIYFILTGCSSDPGSKNETTKFDTAIEKTSLNTTMVSTETIKRPPIFSPITTIPKIYDTIEFIRQLKELGDFGGCWNGEIDKPREQISFYKTVKIYGSDKDYILIEYDHGSGASNCFPYKYQFLFNLKGELITTLNVLRFEFVEIFPNQNPFLLTVTSTSKGNGGHQLYKFTTDTLENIYKGYYDYRVQTYDAGENEYVFEPNELKATFNDVDKDGYKDLIFRGKLVLIQGLTKDSSWYDGPYSIDNPYKKMPMHYVFLYDSTDGFFKESKELSRGNPFIN